MQLVTKFHVTTANRLDSIRRYGLSPGHPCAIGGDSEPYHTHKKGRLFLCDPAGVHFWLGLSDCYVRSTFDRFEYRPNRIVPVVLRVNVFDSMLSRDLFGTADAYAAAYFTTATIPQDSIEVWNRTRWDPLRGSILDLSDAFSADGRLEDNSKLRDPDIAYPAVRIR